MRYAKTLYLPEPPDEAKSIISSFTKNKVPHFFKFAKDKEKDRVEPVNNSTVNKLYEIIPNKPIQFKRISGKFDHKDLMYYKNPQPSDELINKFKQINLNKHTWLDKNPSSSEFHFNNMMREELHRVHKSEVYIVDVLIEYLYTVDSKYKSGLWDVYGDVIYVNLVNNLKGTISCEDCKVRIQTDKDNELYCVECKTKRILESKRKWKKGRKS